MCPLSLIFFNSEKKVSLWVNFLFIQLVDLFFKRNQFWC
jgi:hypothetical protein